MEDVILNGPKVLSLAPGEIAVVLDALAELPFKRANGTILNIMSQLRLQNPQKDPPIPLTPEG